MRKKIHTDRQLLHDLHRVARLTDSPKLSAGQYDELGRYSHITICRRFGSWKNALTQVGLQPAHWLNISAPQLIADLQRIAAMLNVDQLRFHQYIQHGQFSRKIIYRLFGRWQSAVEAAGLVPVIQRPDTDEELLQNLAWVMTRLGRNPTLEELRPPLSRFGPSVYTYRFGTMSNALNVLTQVMAGQQPLQDAMACCVKGKRSSSQRHNTPRTVNSRLRFLVMQRDHFRCQACGRSPATHGDVVLQADHKIPWSQGGESVIDNLQTLCSVCNAGKSNLPWV